MKYLAALALTLAIALPLPALAGTFPVPSEDPVGTVSIPDSWEPKPYEGGVEGTSSDGGVYIAVEQVEANDVGSATEEGIKWFAKQGVELDGSSLKTQDMKINGLPAFDMAMKGKDKDGPTEVSLTLVGTNKPNKFLFVYFWGSAKGQKDNMGELSKIAESIQATK